MITQLAHYLANEAPRNALKGSTLATPAPPIHIPDELRFHRHPMGCEPMSLTPMLWAMKAAPVADTTEKLILISLAERADEDGCDAFPSKATLAKDAICDEKTVQRKLGKLVDRKLIGLGDQRAAQYIEKRYRPKVYDLLIPYSWFPDVDEINESRRRRGRGLLTPENRPDIVPAPTRRERSDKGKPRTKQESTPPRGDTKSPLTKPDSAPAPGGTDRPTRGDSQSQQGGLTDPQTSPVKPPHSNLPGAPSARSAGDGRRPSTGSSARGTSSGAAATGSAKAPQSKSTRKPVLVTAQVQQVLNAYPPRLREAMMTVARTDRPKSLVNAIQAELGGRGEAQVERLVARVQRRWSTHQYADLVADGRLAKPVGAAIAMVKAGPCPSSRCEDGKLDDGTPCWTCIEREKDFHAERRAAAEKQADEVRRRACPYCERDRGTAGKPCPECTATLEGAQRDIAAFVDRALADYAALGAGRDTVQVRERLGKVVDQAYREAAAAGANSVGQALAARFAVHTEANAIRRELEEVAIRTEALAASADRTGHSAAAAIPALMSTERRGCPGHDGTGCPTESPGVGSDGLCVRCRSVVLTRPPHSSVD
ncbi:helix-turn-helix domain-containing protein [Streptomyces sp. NPDC059679]|uniref:helix-turn-helix domain-containing protein n=1 Tax=Streptomyces sp. NPDC059679 TaxID=3346903 RepID=UPI0036C20C5C